MRLTYQKIIDLQSLNRGWNSTVLGKLGVTWPPKRGWLKRLVDSDFPEDIYNECLALKDSHLRAKTIARLREAEEA